MRTMIVNAMDKAVSVKIKGSLSAALVAAFIFILFAGSLKAGNQRNRLPDSLACLEIEGRITNAEIRQPERCMVELICNDGSIDTLLLNNKNKFKLMLGKNTFYSIRISMTGYVTKLISVNTEMPEGTDFIYRFEFETSLLREDALVHLNKDAAEMPIAIVHFSNDGDCFVYNKKYTSNVKKQMRNTGSFKNKNEPLISIDSKNRAAAYTN